MTVANQIEMPDTLEKGVAGDFGSAAILDKWLPSGVTISSASVLSFTGDGDLTVDNVGVNGAEHRRAPPNETETYDAGLVVTYDVSGGVAGTTYRVRFSATLSNGDVWEVIQPWKVRS